MTEFAAEDWDWRENSLHVISLFCCSKHILLYLVCLAAMYVTMLDQGRVCVLAWVVQVDTYAYTYTS